MTPDEFGAKIKAKYPDYASIDNAELSRRIIAKHPEYASQVEMRDAVAQTTQSSAPGILDALTTKNLEGASGLDPFAQVARLGQFANRGNQQYADIIAEQSGRMGAALDRGIPGLGGAVTDAGIVAAGVLGTASEFLLPQNRLGAAAYAISPMMRAYQSLRGASTAYAKPGTVAQLGQARTKVPAGDIQQAINDPSVFTAPSVTEANIAYGEAAGPLQGAARSLRQQTGKTLLGEADWTEAINRPGRILAGTEMKPGVSLPERIISKKEMIGRGADGSLSKAYERNIPINKLDGLEPVPASDIASGKYVAGREITVPIEVSYNAATDKYVVYGGNHRIAQAKANGDSFITAFIEPDGGQIGQSATTMFPLKMDSQTALEGIQSINRFMRNKVNTAKLDKEQLGELLKQKDLLMTFLEEHGTPGMREAALVLRKAHVRENLGRIMPQNKFGGTDALRTMGAGATAAGAASLALAGHPIAAIPLALEAATSSPALWGGAIRNYQAISNPSVMGMAGQAITASQNIPKYVVRPSGLEDAYNQPWPR